MHCWPRTLLWLVIALLGTLNLLSACGQKGPLYLPPPAEPAKSETPQHQ
jgi:predicted small lipoprotein YifL